MATIGHTLLPESPKFLMSIGKNEEALEVFKNMYALNFNKSGNLYPVSFNNYLFKTKYLQYFNIFYNFN